MLIIKKLRSLLGESKSAHDDLLVDAELLGRIRNGYAHTCIMEYWEEGGRCYGNYLGWLELLPPAIVKHGLIKCCEALLKHAKGNLRKTPGLLYADIQGWLCDEHLGSMFGDLPFTGDDRLLQILRQADQETLRRAQDEAMAFIGLLTKYATAYLRHGRRITRPLL